MADLNLAKELLKLSSSDPRLFKSAPEPDSLTEPTPSEPPLFMEEEPSDIASALLELSPQDIEARRAFLLGSEAGGLESEKAAGFSFGQIGARPGIRLVEDPSALTFGQRAAAQAYAEVEDRVNYLNTVLERDPNIDTSIHRARYDTARGLIIPRFNDKTGKVEDVAMDPAGFDIGDITADLSSEIVPTVISALVPMGIAARLGMPALKAFTGYRGIAGLSAATAASRQASEAAYRAMQGIPQPTVGEMAKRGGFELATDFLFNAGITKGVQFISGIGNRFSDPSFKNYKDALEKLNSEFGNNIVPTLGEESNLTPLLKLEQFQQKLIFAGERLRKLNSEKERAILQSVSDLMERQLGQGVDVDLIDPAFGILNEFDAAIDKIELENLSNANELIDSTVDQFLAKLDEVAPSVRFANSTKAGKFIRNSLQQKLDLFRTQAAKNYGEALQAIDDYKRTYGDQIDFDFLVKLDDPRQLVRDLASTAKSFKLEKAVDPATLLTTEVKVPVFNKELLSSTVGKWAKLINRNKDGMSLETAINLRRQIDDDVDVLGGWQSGGIPKNQLRELQSLRASIQKSIDDAVDQFPDSTLKDKWKLANEQYQADRDKFKIGVVNDILENAPADRMPDIDVLPTLAANNKNYENLKSLFSDNPVTWGRVKRAIVDSVANPAEISAGLINPDQFVSGLRSLPEAVLEDIFGTQYKSTLSYFDKLSKATPGKTAGLKGSDRRQLLTVDPAIINEIIREGGLTERSKAALRQSIVTSNNYQRLADSELGKKLKSVPLREGLLDNDTFVATLVEAATPSEARSMASRIGTGEQSQLFKQKVIRHFLQKTNTLTSVKELRRGRPFDFKKGFVGEKLRDEFERKREVYEAYLGDEIMDILDSFVSVGLFTDETARRAGRNVGSLVAGENMANMVESITNPKAGIISSIRDQAGYMLVSVALANPLSRKLLLNRTFDASNPKFMTALVGSEIFSSPFLASYQDKELGAKDLADLIGAFTSDAEDDLESIRRVQGDPANLIEPQSGDSLQSQLQSEIEPQPQPAQQ